MTCIHLTNLRLAHKNNFFTQEINLAMQAGEIWGILGPNGSGKTTLLHSLANLHKNYSGEIQLNRSPIHHYSVKELALHRGILFQQLELFFSETVWEFCSMSFYAKHHLFSKQTQADKNIITHTLAQLDLLHLKNRHVFSLSGGEKQRLSLAALFIQSPSIYLLDEPTNHLDISHQFNILNLFKTLVKQDNKLIIASLHDINLAQWFCDHLIFIFNNGRVLTGSKQELLTSAHLSELYGEPISCITHDNNTLWQVTRFIHPRSI